MSKVEQSSIVEYTTDTTKESVTRTIIFPLETSKTKNEHVREKIEEWQEIAGYFADVLPSYPEHQWSRQNTHLYRHMNREFLDMGLSKAVAMEAYGKVVESYNSWASNGREGDRPTFGERDYLRARGDMLELHKNHSGYGLKAKLEPYNPIWFAFAGGSRQRDYLQGIVDGEYSAGSGELHLHDDGSLDLHWSLSSDVDVYEASDLTRWVGVDLGENVIYACACPDPNGGKPVVMENGREFRHYREEFKRKRTQLMENGDLRGLKSLRDEHRRYTDHVTHVASRRIIEFAESHAPCGIRLENLTGYRESAEDPIHDFPFAELQEKIAYKATEAGIPVAFVNPRNTSVTCRKCGNRDREQRDGKHFECFRCGYEVHADINAAFNIAQGGILE